MHFSASGISNAAACPRPPFEGLRQVPLARLGPLGFVEPLDVLALTPRRQCREAAPRRAAGRRAWPAAKSAGACGARWGCRPMACTMGSRGGEPARSEAARCASNARSATYRCVPSAVGPPSGSDRPLRGDEFRVAVPLMGRVGEFAGQSSRHSCQSRRVMEQAASAYVSSSSHTGHSCRQRPFDAMTGMRPRP